MKDQIIITMGREHGSGGHYIADMITRELGIKLYDKDSIESEIVSEGYSEELIRRMDEKPVNFFASRRIGRFSNSLEVNVAEKTFDMIRAKAASGESFLLIGRCGEQVLKDDPHRVSLFIGGDPHAKLCRVMEKKGLSAEEAIEEIRTVDHQRKAYHNYYCETKWGDARGYDMTVKSDVLGFEGTAFCLSGFGGRLGLDVIIRQCDRCQCQRACGRKRRRAAAVRYGLACQLGYLMHIVRALVGDQVVFLTGNMKNHAVCHNGSLPFIKYGAGRAAENRRLCSNRHKKIRYSIAQYDRF